MMKPGINVDQRNIVLIPFPYSDLSNIKKKRPALIISNNKFNNSNDDVICCLITRNPDTYGNLIDVCDKDLEEGDIYFKSMIKPCRLFTVSKERVIKILAKLNLKKTEMVIKEVGNLIKTN